MMLTVVLSHSGKVAGKLKNGAGVTTHALREAVFIMSSHCPPGRFRELVLDAAGSFEIRKPTKILHARGTNLSTLQNYVTPDCAAACLESKSRAPFTALMTSGLPTRWRSKLILQAYRGLDHFLFSCVLETSLRTLWSKGRNRMNTNSR